MSPAVADWVGVGVGIWWASESDDYARKVQAAERLLSVLYPDRPLEARATVVSLADRGRPFDQEGPENAA